jgi:hypothetical protein
MLVIDYLCRLWVVFILKNNKIVLQSLSFLYICNP